MKKRLISLFCVFAMCMTMLGTPQYAELFENLVANAVSYSWPLDTSIGVSYNYYAYANHGGCDFSASAGSPVYAVASGTVSAVDCGCQGSHRSDGTPKCSNGSSCPALNLSSNGNGSFGNHIKIDHGNGVVTYYCHLRTGFEVANGQYVSQGQLIGYSGASGNVTGPHLHFEFRRNGSRLDPEQYLERVNVNPTPPPTDPPAPTDPAPTLPANNSQPVVHLEQNIGGAGQITLKGWAFDPDTPSTAVNIHVYLSPANDTAKLICIGSFFADDERTDVDREHGCGTHHGFQNSLYVTEPGEYLVRIAALDTTYGGDAAYWEKGDFVWITEPPVFTITYDMNGGSGSITAQKKTQGVDITLSKTIPTKEYKIQYDAMGGTLSEESKSASCVFMGWNTSKTAETAAYKAGSTFQRNADTTLYAVWSNPKAGALEVPVKDGYLFDGWYTAETGGTKVESDTVISKTTKFYARWTEITVVSAKLTKQPQKLVYYTGDTLETEGLELTVEKNDGTTQTITEGFVCEPTLLEKTGEQIITVKYGDFTDAFTVEVKEPKVTEITYNLPEREYKAGDKADLSELVLYVKYENGSSEQVTDGFTYEDVTFEKAGVNTVVVTYKGYEVPVEFVVLEDGVMGDVNKDGFVDLKDVVLLRRYIVGGWDVTIDERLADVNVDGNINLKDVILIRRYIVGGWGVILGGNESTPNKPTEDSTEPTEAPEQHEEIIHEVFEYGESENGRALQCHSIAPKTYEKTILLNFAIHGFEDDYDRDGQVLVDTANTLIAHYQEAESLHGCRLLIVPCANPDGLLDGTTNNGFGRCNAKGIDLNRDFDANYSANTTEGRNYTPYAFSAAESQALRDLCLEHSPDIVLDFHGWLNYTIGDIELAEVFYSEMGLSHHTSFTHTNAKGYFANWAHQQGSLGLLVEFTNTEIPMDGLIAAIDRLICDEYDNGKGEYTPDSRFAKFDSISAYTLALGKVPTYQGFDIPFETESFIAGDTDLCTIDRVYQNGWVRVTYPIASGSKTAYCHLSDFVDPDMMTTFYSGKTTENTKVYRSTKNSETIGSVWTTDVFTVIAQNDTMVQILYPVDGGGWKMGWIERRLCVPAFIGDLVIPNLTPIG